MNVHDVDVSHQASHKLLGHHVIHNVTKFQSCRLDNYIFIGKKHCENSRDTNNILSQNLLASHVSEVTGVYINRNIPTQMMNLAICNHQVDCTFTSALCILPGDPINVTNYE